MTTVVLDGALGDKFGTHWELFANSPAEALRLITANKPDFPNWIADNLTIYENYCVTCEYENGKTQTIAANEIDMLGKIKTIRFSPVIAGSGNTFSLIAGVLLIAVASFFTFGAAAVAGTTFMAALGSTTIMGFAASSVMLLGVGLTLSGVLGMISPQPKTGAQGVNRESKYFNGAVNTSVQGVPVPLIYGQCLVGSHPISVNFSISDVPIKK